MVEMVVGLSIRNNRDFNRMHILLTYREAILASVWLQSSDMINFSQGLSHQKCRVGGFWGVFN